jgi:hypothetical protein
MKEHFWVVEIVLTLVVILGYTAFMKWDRARSDRGVRESVGVVKGVDVGIVSEEGREWVGVTFEGGEDYTRVLVSPAQARALAEFLRIAAAKGKTLTMARVNHRRAKMGPAPG